MLDEIVASEIFNRKVAEQNKRAWEYATTHLGFDAMSEEYSVWKKHNPLTPDAEFVEFHYKNIWNTTFAGKATHYLLYAVASPVFAALYIGQALMDAYAICGRAIDFIRRV